MKKSKFQMPSSITTIIILSVIIAILTFIIPAGEYTYEDNTPIAGTYKQVDPNPQGLWNIVSAPIVGFKQAIDIIMFVLVMGGSLGIVFETKAIDAALAIVTEKLKGRERLMIPLIMIMFSIGGTTFNMAEETLVFYPIIMPILLAAGYDVITGIMTVFLGASIGITGGIVSPFSVGIASNLAGISLADGLFVRLILYLSYLTFAITFVMRYAEKVRQNPQNSVVYDIKDLVEKPFKKGFSEEVPEFTTKRKIVLGVFGLMFLIMIIGIIPWSYKFNIPVFENIHNAIKSVPVLGTLVGDIVPLGDWGFKEMTVLFFAGSILIGIFYGMKEGEIVSLFISGCRDLLGVALTIAVAKGISVIMKDGLIIDTILNFGENILSGINKVVFPAITYIVYIGLSFLIPSSSGLATATIPILAPLGEFLGVSKEYVVMVFQAGAETMNMISPTQAVLIGALTLANVPYDRWIKKVWPFVLGIMIITIVVVSIASSLF